MLSKEDREYIKILIVPITIKLENINEQLGKINGKVQKHEALIDEALIERATNRERQRTESIGVETLKKTVVKIEEEMLPLKILKTYPKLSIYTAVGLTAFIIYEVLMKII